MYLNIIPQSYKILCNKKIKGVDFSRWSYLQCFGIMFVLCVGKNKNEIAMKKNVLNSLNLSKIIILIDRDDGKKKQIMATPSSMAFV